MLVGQFGVKAIVESFALCCYHDFIQNMRSWISLKEMAKTFHILGQFGVKAIVVYTSV